MKNIVRNFTFLLVIISVLIFPVLNAQDITGDWYGVWQIEDSLHLNLHIYKNYDRLNATFDIPDHEEFGVPITLIKLVDDTLLFWIYGYGVHFKGFVNRDYSQINGEAEQGGQKYGLDFGRNKLVLTSDTTLTVIPAKIFGIYPVNFQEIPYNGIKKVKAGNPRVIKIDTSKLNVLTPGKGTTLSPRMFELQELITKDSGVDQENYVQYAPAIARVIQT
jgi:hypothetical protein